MIGFISTSITITINYNAHNQWLSKTRSIPYWTTSVFYSTMTDLVLIYKSVTSAAIVVRWLTLHSWTLNYSYEWIREFKVKVTLRLKVSQSVSLGVEPHLGLMTRYLLLFDRYGLVHVGRPLWREDGSVFCVCCWSLPAQSFLGPESLGTRDHILLFQICDFLFVASYDSQSHGGGIRPRLTRVFSMNSRMNSLL
jgi:hypothetical protein